MGRRNTSRAAVALKRDPAVRRCCATDCRPLATVVRDGDPDVAAHARMFQALGQRARLRMVWLLARHGALCVRAFPRPADVNQPTVSHHLTVLRDAGLLSRERRGRRSYYSLKRDVLKELIRALIGVL